MAGETDQVEPRPDTTGLTHIQTSEVQQDVLTRDGKAQSVVLAPGQRRRQTNPSQQVPARCGRIRIRHRELAHSGSKLKLSHLFAGSTVRNLAAQIAAFLLKTLKFFCDSNRIKTSDQLICLLRRSSGPSR
jgi:hypothetical protein